MVKETYTARTQRIAREDEAKELKEYIASLVGLFPSTTQLLNALVAAGIDVNSVLATVDSTGGANSRTDILDRLLRANLASREQVQAAVDIAVEAGTSGGGTSIGGVPTGATGELVRIPGPFSGPAGSIQYEDSPVPRPQGAPAAPEGRTTTGAQNLQHPLLTPPAPRPGKTMFTVPKSGEEKPEIGKVTKATEKDGLGLGADAGTGLDLGAGTGVVGPPALRSDASPEEVDAHIRKHYGYLSWALDVPDIRQIAKDVAQNPSGWTEATIMGAITATPWWQDNGTKAAEWLQRRAQDPATTQDEIKEQFDSFRASTREAGIDIPDDRLWDIAEESLKWGWSEGTIQAVLGSEYRFDPSKPTATTRSLKAKAAEYLVPIGDDSLGTWAKQMLTGQKSEEEFTQYVSGMAKSMFPFMADALDRGDTVAQYVSSYAEAAARTLEISPEEVDFTQPKWMRLLTKTDPKTGERGPMAIHEMDRIIRTDSQYGYEYTKQAKDEAGFLASTIMKKMGVTA